MRKKRKKQPATARLGTLFCLPKDADLAALAASKQPDRYSDKRAKGDRLQDFFKVWQHVLPNNPEAKKLKWSHAENISMKQTLLQSCWRSCQTRIWSLIQMRTTTLMGSRS